MGVAGVDFIEFDKENSRDDGNPFYGKADDVEHLIGLNWSWRGKPGWNAETSLSHMYTRYQDRFWSTADDSLAFDDVSGERSVSLRNVTYHRLGSGSSLKFGLDAKYSGNDYQTFSKSYHDQYGNVVSSLQVDRNISTLKLGTFLIYNWSPLPRLEFNLGGRFDYFEFNRQKHFSPRTSFRYHLTERTALTGSAGVYYQSLPLTILAQNPDFKRLRDPLAYHFILGISRLVGEDTRLTVEVYDKQYRRFPMDPTKPALFPGDEGGSHELLVDNGRALARGLEVVLQKKLARDFYGLASGAVFQSRYRGYDNRWRDRIYGNRYLFNVEGGYIASEKWEFSVRWVFAGGRPFTPYDTELSSRHNTGIYDLARINGERHPSYHSLNLRADRRFNFRDSNLILFWDLWNVYNRKNIASYYWNDIENKLDRDDQWSFLPVFGLEWEF